ncbi:MAG TPA: flavin reductase [Peptococcaceae bacterium]|nr:flavin reductase [Peptococcaceae bacterium]
MKWKCIVCGYIHEGEEPPEFCPVCGVDASNFEKIEDQDSDSKASVEYKPEPRAEKENKKIFTPEEALTKAIRSISYGLFIITAHYQGRDNGQTANTCFQITSEPVQVAIGINKNNLTHEFIQKSGKFGVSILDRNGHDLARRFGYRSGREVDKFAGLTCHRGQSGVLLPDGVLACLEAEVVNQLDCGTHTLFIGRVIAGEYFDSGEPMTYAYFRSTK